MGTNETTGVIKSAEEVVYVRVDHEETPLQSKDDYLQLDVNSAAEKIQAHYRGYRVRKMLKNQEESMGDSREREEQLYVTGNAVKLLRDEGNLRESSNVEEYSESPLIAMVAHIEDLNPHSEEQKGLTNGATANESLEVTEPVNVLPNVIIAQNVVEAALRDAGVGVKETLQEEHNVGSVSEQKEESRENFTAHEELKESTTVQENVTDHIPQAAENQCDQKNDTDDEKMQSSLRNNHEDVADTNVVESSCQRGTEKTENDESPRLEQVDVVESQHPDEGATEDSIIEEPHPTNIDEVPQVAE